MVDVIEQDINLNPAGLGVRNLRSGIATVQVLVRFWNLTGINVDIIWVNEEGRGIRFGQLKKNQYIDITTYEGHPWIFRESGVGDILIGQPGNISVRILYVTNILFVKLFFIFYI
uniref:VHL domain-containing protein n=1 Tax=Heterorhabditis bacteriophora TaxID=37862 RepID=A0A1I7X6U9_HETBA